MGDDYDPKGRLLGSPLSVPIPQASLATCPVPASSSAPAFLCSPTRHCRNLGRSTQGAEPRRTLSLSASSPGPSENEGLLPHDGGNGPGEHSRRGKPWELEYLCWAGRGGLGGWKENTGDLRSRGLALSSGSKGTEAAGSGSQGQVLERSSGGQRAGKDGDSSSLPLATPDRLFWSHRV